MENGSSELFREHPACGGRRTQAGKATRDLLTGRACFISSALSLLLRQLLLWRPERVCVDIRRGLKPADVAAWPLGWSLRGASRGSRRPPEAAGALPVCLASVAPAAWHPRPTTGPRRGSVIYSVGLGQSPWPRQSGPRARRHVPRVFGAVMYELISHHQIAFVSL